MQIFSDIDKNKEEIIESINRHGFTAEHNFYCFFYDLGKDEVNRFVSFDNNQGILAKYNEKKKEWRIFSEVLAQPNKRNGLLLNFCTHIFANSEAKKIIVELSDESRNQLLLSIKNSELRANKINYSLEWPVFDFKSWTGDKMEGKDWKDLRYYWNKFHRDHDVKFVGCEEFNKNELLKILEEWKKNRKCSDYIKIRPYQLMIENGFNGFDHTRVLVVDGEPAGITGGFRLNNNNNNNNNKNNKNNNSIKYSNENSINNNNNESNTNNNSVHNKKFNYYSCVGILNYKYDRMGEIMNMDDLFFLKKQGYNLVDFGGSFEEMIPFKKKFFPTYWYKTHIFSIVKKIQKDKRTSTNSNSVRT